MALVCSAASRSEASSYAINYQLTITTIGVMKWYLAKIVFQIICGDGNHIPQFDEQLRLISAVNEGEAFEKASEIGRNEQDSFYNLKQQLVRWNFINVLELYHLTELIDGAEVYSRISEVDDAEAYNTFVHKRAESIRMKHTHQLLNLI